MRSPYTLDKPPPDEPPPGVLCPSLWPVQVRWWRRHTPLDQSRVCAVCNQSWPCHSWACWDGQLGDAVAASEEFKAERAATRKRRLKQSAAHDREVDAVGA